MDIIGLIADILEGLFGGGTPATGIPPLGCDPFDMDLAPPQMWFNVAPHVLALNLLPDNGLLDLAPKQLNVNLAPPEMTMECNP